ncbi:methyltransferase family protein [Salsuginibacillus halophilus]|uniref:Methyltransferase family protein n=1 Tax=Salsuginibacillus halophilus TaxID=517424 RepID=A0A2P8HFP8_9BACI|nr:class I SAM-dependent methyltransferase [Salsuginibacillus halophilus]PSL45052.1 methyltransferase family protein [Salsuginibacillus halophilus]
MYERLSWIYDDLMEDAPYQAWAERVKTSLLKHEQAVNHVLDLGCGTGTMMLLLLDEGYHVTGVDLSAEMLAAAQGKAAAHGYEPPLFAQDMRALEGLGTYDAVMAWCDTLNYAGDETDVERVFSGVKAHLKPGGLFLFDVHTPYKMTEVFPGTSFADASEDVTVIWNVFTGEDPLSVEHELTFFEEHPSGLYERSDETHMQRTFQPEEYRRLLEAQGFSRVHYEADHPDEAVAERFFFTAER